MFPGTVTTNKITDRVAVVTDNSNGALSSSQRALRNDIVVATITSTLVSAVNDVYYSVLQLYKILYFLDNVTLEVIFNSCLAY